LQKRSLRLPCLDLRDRYGLVLLYVCADTEQSQTVSALHDALAVRADLLAIALNMLSAGISIPWISAQRIQQHVASACDAPWTRPTEALTSLILPALRDVLDSSHRIVVGPPNAKKTCLVGALFVPVVIDFFREFDKHDFLTQRCLLDIMMVTFFKHDVRTVELAALSALQSLAEFAAGNQSVENRLLAIQVVQTALSRMETHCLSRAVPYVGNEYRM